MFRLDLPAEPYWLDLPQGVRVRVRPLSAAVAAAARSYATRQVLELLRAAAERIAFGAPPDGPNLDDKDVRDGLTEEFFAIGLAKSGIIAWEGVGDAADNPAPCTPPMLEAFGRSALAGDFIRAYEAPLARAADEGNASAPGPSGPSVPGANTATDAPSPAPSALVH